MHNIHLIEHLNSDGMGWENERLQNGRKMSTLYLVLGTRHQLATKQSHHQQIISYALCTERCNVWPCKLRERDRHRMEREKNGIERRRERAKVRNFDGSATWRRISFQVKENLNLVFYCLCLRERRLFILSLGSAVVQPKARKRRRRKKSQRIARNIMQRGYVTQTAFDFASLHLFC